MAKVLKADRERLAGKVRRGERLNVADYEVLLAVIDEALEEEEARLAAAAGKRALSSLNPVPSTGRRK